jgi:hypothetical protein
MSTESLARSAAAVAVAALMALAPAPGRAEAPDPPRGAAADEAIDLALGALEAPRLETVRPPPDVRGGIPAAPPYDQQPPDVQRNFEGLQSPKDPPPP